jgi:exosortase
MNARPWFLAAALVAAVLIGAAVFGDTLRWLADSWLTNPNYSHGILVPLIAAYFVWRARSAFRSRAPNNLGLILLGATLLVHLLAIPLRIYPLSAFALVVALMSLVLLIWGFPALRASGWAYAVLFLMIPLPLIDQLSPSLEAFTARIAAGSVALLGTQAVTIGSQVQLPTVAFEVGAACSGLRSLASLVTLAVVFSGIAQGPAWGKGLILLAAAPLAIGANLLRVASILQFAQLFGVDAGLAYYHDYSSPVLFLLAFSLLILFGRTVRCSEIRLG